MSQEDVNVDVVEQEVNDTQPLDSTPELSPVQQKAMDGGWRPKEEWEGDPDKWVDADEFVRRGPLFEKIDSVSRELKEARKVIKTLSDHYSKVRETEYQRALQDIKDQKKQAFEDGDADRLIELDEQLADIKAAEKVAAAQAQKQAAAPDPRFTTWVSQNDWYGSDRELREFADQVGLAYKSANPTIDPVEVLDYVTKRVRKAFPERFKNERKERPTMVESSNASRNTAKKSAFELTDDERRAMKVIVGTGALTEEQYIADLKAIKGIKE